MARMTTYQDIEFLTRWGMTLIWDDPTNLWGEPENAQWSDDTLVISGTVTNEQSAESHAVSVTFTGEFEPAGDALDGPVTGIEITMDGALAAVIEDDVQVDISSFYGLTSASGLFHDHLFPIADQVYLADGGVAHYDADIDQVFYGGTGGDVINMLYGSNIAYGGNGDDLISARSPEFTVYGGRGDDALWVSGSRGTAIGGDGNDEIKWGNESAAIDHLLKGGAGDDSFIHDGRADGAGHFGEGRIEMVGGEGADSFMLVGPTYMPGELGAVIKDFSLEEGDTLSLEGIRIPSRYDIETVHYLGDDPFTGAQVAGLLEIRMEDGLVTMALGERSAFNSGAHTPLPDLMVYLRGHDSFDPSDMSWLTLPEGVVLTDQRAEAPDYDGPKMKLVMTKHTDTWRKFISQDEWVDDGPWHVLDDLDGPTNRIRISKYDALGEGTDNANKHALVIKGDFAEGDDGWAGQVTQVKFANKNLGAYITAKNLPDDLDLADLIASDSPDAFLDLIAPNGLKYVEQVDARGYPTSQSGTTKGVDTLIGHDGENNFRGDIGQDILKGGKGDDYLSGGAYVYGGKGDDEFYGGTHMDGGKGDDLFTPGDYSIMTGGAGADTFRFYGETWLPGQLGTRITDFTPEDGDKLDFEGLSTTSLTGARYIGDRAFSGTDETILEIRMEDGLLTMDADGDGMVDALHMVMIDGYDSLPGDDLGWMILPGNLDFI